MVVGSQARASRRLVEDSAAGHVTWDPRRGQVPANFSALGDYYANDFATAAHLIHTHGRPRGKREGLVSQSLCDWQAGASVRASRSIRFQSMNARMKIAPRQNVLRAQ